MTYMSVKVLSLILVYYEFVYLQVNGEIVYEAEFSEDFRSCKNFDNNHVNCDSFKIDLVDGNEDEEGGIGLNGDLEVLQSVIEGYQMSIEAWKLMDVGKEFAFASVTDLCKNLKSEDAPWYPLVKSMNVSACPIPEKIYPITDLIISLDFAKDLLCFEFCGEYEVILSLLDEKEETVTCYVVGISVTEVEKER
ncbi:uncharacterized protein [Battus philenor]|uniref:uncharacterized protein n=1 Tax=Battus philenor TaxID=42288 RepID=UPI0035D13103